MSTDPIALALVAAALLGLLGAILYVRRRDAATAAEADARLARARAEGADQPPSLHPVIDPQICIGSLSCVSACPEGDILGIVNGAATLVQGASCIGHGRCANECPVDAIKLVFGSSERGVDLPEVDAHFESSQRGVYVVGELGGMGLIKNAMLQGVQAASHVAERLPGHADDGADRLDVVVVGAGPAGVAAATALQHAGLRYRVLEQGPLGGAIASYPRQKLVMTETVQLPGWGAFGRRRMSKEHLIADLERLVAHFDLPIQCGARVEAVTGAAGDFTVTTTEGEVRARAVILAIGRRGTPRRLGVPGEDASKVTYALLDPEQYADRRVLVVGGGDSAVEAAVSLAEAGAEATISYRKPAFARCRAANRERIEAAIAAGRVRALMGTEVTTVADTEVTLTDREGHARRIANDYVVIQAGGVLPTEFLARAGVGMKRHAGQDALASPATRASRRDEATERRGDRRLAYALTGLGIATVAALAYLGGGYYALDAAARRDSPLHEAWRPAGDIGHGIGVVASLVMLSNFLYPLRKRLGWFKGTAPIRRWLTFHVFVGLLSPAVIAFHAAFQSNNLVATGTFASLLVVVGTGLVGRYVYGLVPRAERGLVAKEVLEDELDRLLERLEARRARAERPEALPHRRWSPTPDHGSARAVLGLLVRYPLGLAAEQVRLRRVRRHFVTAADYRDFADASLLLYRVSHQLELYESLRRFLSWWRVLHVSLALLLVTIMGAHIGVALYLGYGWILL